MANFSVSTLQKPDADPDPVALRLRSAPRRRGAPAGRLNVFQAAMLDWRDLHPYNAVHAAEIVRPLDRDALSRCDRRELAQRRAHRTRARSRAQSLRVARRPRHGTARDRRAGRGLARRACTDVRAAIERAISRATGPLVPFRFFAVPGRTGFFLGLAYDHFIAGGDSIIVLLNAIADRYAGRAGTPAPLRRYPRRHRRLLRPASAAGCPRDWRACRRSPRAAGARSGRTIGPSMMATTRSRSSRSTRRNSLRCATPRRVGRSR